MKTALAKVTKASAPAAPERNRIRKTSEVLRKLSLNAAKNWHQNSGAKRLDSIRGDGIAPVLQNFRAGGALPAIKMGGPWAAQEGSSQTKRNYRDKTQLQTEFSAIDGIYDDRGHRQGDGDNGGYGKQ